MSLLSWFICGWSQTFVSSNDNEYLFPSNLMFETFTNELKADSVDHEVISISNPGYRFLSRKSGIFYSVNK